MFSHRSSWRDYIPAIIAILLSIGYFATIYHLNARPTKETDYKETDYDAGYYEGRADGYDDGYREALLYIDDELNQRFCDGYDEGYADALKGIEPQY